MRNRAALLMPETRASNTPTLSRWFAAMDAVAVCTAVLGVLVALLGGFSTYIAGVRLSVRSAERVLFVAAGLVAIRHAASSVDPLHRRLRRLITSGSASLTVRAATAALLSRVLVLLVGYFAVLTIGIPQPGGFRVSSDALTNLPARFDAGWYTGIADHGYRFLHRFDKQQNLAFFPAYPFAMRTVSFLAGADQPGIPREQRLARMVWSGVFVSIAAFLWGAWYLARLARDLLGEAYAMPSVVLLAAYPFAVFFSAPYTESLFLLGTVAAFYHFRRREWTAASVWGLLVGLTRANGCFLSVPLGLLAIEPLWHARRPGTPPSGVGDRLRGIARPLATAAMPGIAMLIYSAYVKHLTGAWFGWAELHAAWGRTYEGSAALTGAVESISTDGLLRVIGRMPFNTLNALGLVFALALLWPVCRRVGFVWGVFVLINVVPPFMAGGVMSMGRITSTLFPMFLALAAVLPRRSIGSTAAGLALVQGLVAVLFFTWRPLY